MDLVSILFGAFLAFLSVTIGMIIEARRNQARTASRPAIQGVIQPICTCDHVISVHVKNGKCKEKKWRSNHGWVDCPCQFYVGPLPLNEVWVPPVYTELTELPHATDTRPE